MKTTTVALSLCLILTACGGGGSGSVVQPESPTKSAYEIWLEQGNTGTYQDFLDSLLSGDNKEEPDDPTGGTDPDNKPIIDGNFVPKNKGEEIEYYIQKGLPYYNYGKSKVILGQQEYNQYKYSEDGKDSLTGTKYTSNYTYNEKELQLGNYIMYTIDREYEDGKNEKYTNWQIVNRYGKNENLYRPEAGTVFNGDTLALMYTGGDNSPEVLTGNITFKYDYLKPELVLAFDNYYQIEFAKTSGHYYDIEISGENSTGNAAFDLPAGKYTSMAPATGPGGSDAFLTTITLSKDGIEEAFGEYKATFDHYDYNLKSDIRIQGVFGGTKQ